MDDRRVFERFSAGLPLRFLSAVDNKEGQAMTYDISAKGIGFSSSEQLAPQTALELWLEVPDKGEPIYTRGQVAWSRRADPANFRTGVELEKADFMGMSRVLRAIESK
jgi:hypothetical protein